MSSSQIRRVRDASENAPAIACSGDATDWNRIHGDVQNAFERLWAKVSAVSPGALSRPGRTTAPAFVLFSYRVFYRADLDEDDPILVGVTIQDQGSSYRVASDVSGEESGTVYYEEAREISKDSPDLGKDVRDLADRLASREAVVLEALSQPTPSTPSDLESEPSRSSDG